MMRRISVACVAMAAVLAAAQAEAGQIGWYQETKLSGFYGVLTSTTIGLADVDFTSEFGVPVLFDETPLTAASVGTTLTATSANPDFAPVVSRMTNGVDGYLFVTYGTAALRHESVAMPLWSYAPANGIDLQGCTIDCITMTIDALTFNTPGRDENGDGNWTDISSTVTLRVYGTAAAVPEPATMTLFALGGLGVTLLRRRPR